MVIIVPVAIAAASPLLASREVVYVVGGMAGIIALALLVAQPLLGAGYLPGLRLVQARRWHRWLGSAIVIAVALHIGGLYLTSPADALDALLLVSPTPFSVYGVIALWGTVLTALLVVAKSRLGLGHASWRAVHNILAAIVVIATVVHALMIEGAMGEVSKLIVCICALAATAIVTLHLRVLKPLGKMR